MVVDLWHLLLLADTAVCDCTSVTVTMVNCTNATITMGDPAGHTLAGTEHFWYKEKFLMTLLVMCI